MPSRMFSVSFNIEYVVSRQLDAENWTRENWSPQPGLRFITLLDGQRGFGLVVNKIILVVELINAGN
jgi:hypothetical protein